MDEWQPTPYAALMANQHKHKARQIRDVPQEDWEDFAKAVPEKETRSSVIAAFIAAYIGKPGARMPRRPKRDRPQEK